MQAPSDKHAGASDRLLTCWKEIANHLGVSVRTAQYYEKGRSLPVRRMGGRVAILESELRAWQLANLTSPPFWVRVRLLQSWALGATLLLLAATLGGVWYYRAHHVAGQPVSARWQGSLLVAADAKGRMVWQRQFNLPLFEVSPEYQLGPRTVDLDGDGNNETVFCYRHVKRESEGWAIYCVSSTGEDRWRMAPTRTVRNASKEFSPPYVVRELAVFPSPEKDGTWWTAVAFAHHVEYPSVLQVVDGKGRLRGEFWQAGHLNSVTTLDLDGDGIVEILTGGIQHGAEQAVLHVLDPRDVHGAANIKPPDSPMQLLEMAAGTEKATVYFPRTDLNRKTGQFNFLSHVELIDGTIQATVYEHVPEPSGYLVYTLNRGLEVTNLAVSVAYKNAVAQAGLKSEWSSLESPAAQERLKRQVRVVQRSK